MVKHRGVFVPKSALSKTFGRDFVQWWISLQPEERGDGDDVGELRAPTAGMSWTAFGSTGGYKGAFLPVWCLTHWAIHGFDRDGFVEVVRDMAAVFRVFEGQRAGRRVR